MIRRQSLLLPGPLPPHLSSALTLLLPPGKRFIHTVMTPPSPPGYGNHEWKFPFILYFSDFEGFPYSLTPGEPCGPQTCPHHPECLRHKPGPSQAGQVLREVAIPFSPLLIGLFGQNLAINRSLSMSISLALRKLSKWKLNGNVHSILHS